jgi:hypothetical protein
MEEQQVVDTQVIENNGQDVENIQVDTQSPQEKVEQILSYDKDPRFTKEWGGDINKMYGALKGYEKVFTPTQQVFKKYGYDIKDPAKLDPVFQEYKTFKDPQNPRNQILSNIERWSNNPALFPKLEQFWKEQQEMEQKLEASRTFGIPQESQLTPQMIDIMEKVKRSDAYIAEQEKAKEDAQKLSTLDQTMVGITEMAKNAGMVDFNELNFLKEFSQTKLAPEMIPAYFLKAYLPKIIESAKGSAAKTVTNNLVKNKNGGALSGSKDGQGGVKKSFQEEMLDLARSVRQQS